MAYKRPINDSDEYVYPTKKVRNQTRNRRHDANLIKEALIGDEFDNDGDDEHQEVMDDYNEMITDFNKAEDDKIVAAINEELGDYYDPFEYNHTFGPCENDAEFIDD